MLGVLFNAFYFNSIVEVTGAMNGRPVPPVVYSVKTETYFWVLSTAEYAALVVALEHLATPMQVPSPCHPFCIVCIEI